LTGDGAELGARQDLLVQLGDLAAITGRMSEGLSRHRHEADAGRRVLRDGSRPSRQLFDAVERIQRAGEPADGFHVALRLTELRCHPSEEGLFEHALDLDFDLDLCAMLRPGELVRIVSRHPDGWLLVRSPYAFGWVREAWLGPGLDEAAVRAYLGPERFVLVAGDRVPVWSTPERTSQVAAVGLGLRLPLLGREESGLVRVLAPSEQGLAPAWIEPGDVVEGNLPLTRRNLIRHSFARLDDSFGWGGLGGDRDCSALLMDLFALFGLELPRNSFWQARSGTRSLDISALGPAEKGERLERGLAEGIVLAYMPGHIMLLIGRDGDSLFAIHQFSGYRTACRPGEDVKMAVDRVAVTDLRLGEGSTRRSFLQRITTMVVLGPSAPASSAGPDR
jgi:hypothetical protein